MNVFQTIRMAFKSIGNSKMRSFLTMLGVIIGVASVIAIVASLQGTTKLQRLQWEAMGTNQIQIFGYNLKRSDWKDFEKYLDEQKDKTISAWSPQSYYYDWQNKDISYRTKTLSADNTQIYFGNQDYGVCTNNVISVGRDISEKDCRAKAKVCVIGETVRKAFFGAMSPIDETIRIGGKSFKVVGVYKDKYGGKLNSNDQMIILPYSLKDYMMADYDNSKQYYVKAIDQESIESAIASMNKFMSTRYDPTSGSSFEAYSNTQWQEQSEASINMLAMVGGGIACISLLVGGIGIMNIMLVSVTERTREIGIRMSIGARRRDIIGQFLIEASVVSAMGGVLGIILGCVLSAVIGSKLLAQQLADSWMPHIEEFTVLPSIGLVLGAFLFSVVLGVFFGIYPAYKASNLQPVDALRSQ